MHAPDLNLSGFAFSEREGEMLALAADGMTDKAIAKHLGLAHGTISTYWERVRKKVGAKSRSEAIAKAYKAAYNATHEQLAEAHEWISIMVECTHDFAIFRTDVEGTLMSWNPGVAGVLGYGSDEFIGRDISMVFTEADRTSELHKSEMKVAKELGRSYDNRWHVRKDGAKIWVEGVMVALKRGEELFGFAKIMQDRTTEYQAQKEVERLVQLHAESLTKDSNPSLSS
jgi:PAS domain S-box-containing protein